MAKAIETYFGENTYGTKIEVALSEHGVWFSRSYGYNGYGQCWSKWKVLDEVTRPTHKIDRNEMSPTWNHQIEVDEEYTQNHISWGFEHLKKSLYKSNTRLPNVNY